MGRRWRKGRKPKDVKWQRKGKREEIKIDCVTCILSLLLTSLY